MASTVWVKVVGFSDAERHSLNTVFRVSRADKPRYVIWIPEHVALPSASIIDVDSYEAGLEMLSPAFNPDLKMIAVGDLAPLSAWRAVQRPLDAAEVVRMLDDLFDTDHEVDADVFVETAPPQQAPLLPSMRCALLVGVPTPQAYYLRARLALAGLLVVDEAQSLEACAVYLAKRRYALAVVYVNPLSEDPWHFAKYLHNLAHLVPQRIGVMPMPDEQSVRQAERLGCSALLAVPFNPQQVFTAFQKV